MKKTLLILGFLCCVLTSSKAQVVGTDIGDIAPEIDLPDTKGNNVVLSSLRGSLTLVDFWASWCGPCIKEMPRILELKELNPNIEFYSISLDKTYNKMKKFIEKNKYDWPIVYGGDEESNKELFNYFHIVAIPKYYVIDREGIIINILDKLDDDVINELR